MLHLSSHPLVHHALTQLRDQATPPPVFRRLVHDLAQFLFLEAAADLQLASVQVTTPLAVCKGSALSQSIGLAPILRAGLGMAQAILDLVPQAQVWHLGLYRDHDTHQPITYYSKLAGAPTIDLAFVLDPMLATGGSAAAAVQLLKDWGMRTIKFIGLIAAPEGVQALTAAHPDVPMHLAAVDSHLDERRYIVPGLGDAGDREFGT